MRYDRLADWLSWLETLHPSAIDMGLERVREVGARLGVLQPGVPVVTVAGTNGKGSVTALLDALLRAHGRRVGLYTSPHILRFNERIRVGGAEAADADIVSALAAVDAARGPVSLTYFEFTTLAAFLLFARAGVDVLVLEIGLGGRLDAVNIVDPDVAVLTSVGLDHQEYLGPTREHIGREKAGVFRAGRPAVIGETDIPDSVRAAVQALATPVFRAGQEYAGQAAGAGWRWQGRAADGSVRVLEDLPRPALALANAATALQALHLLPWPVLPAAVGRGLRTVRLAGRNQRLAAGGRTLVLDVGHNPHGLAFLVAELQRESPGLRCDVLLGLLADKDADGVARALEPVARSWHIAPLPGPRGGGIERLTQAVTRPGGAPVRVYADVPAALHGALATADDRPLLVTGSFHTVAAVLTALGWQALPAPADAAADS